MYESKHNFDHSQFVERRMSNEFVEVTVVTAWVYSTRTLVVVLLTAISSWNVAGRSKSEMDNDEISR